MGVRTNAPLMQFKSILVKYSLPTYTGGQADGSLQAIEDVQAGTEGDFAEESIWKGPSGTCCLLLKIYVENTYWAHVSTFVTVWLF